MLVGKSQRRRKYVSSSSQVHAHIGDLQGKYDILTDGRELFIKGIFKFQKNSDYMENTYPEFQELEYQHQISLPYFEHSR
jgi:hypothetical protein